MNIFFFETKKWERKYLRKRLRKHNLKFFEERVDIEKAKEADVISLSIYSHIDKKALKKLPRLKLITTRSTGFDHIDIKECSKKGITVSNVPAYGEKTVAEHTFALILSLSRNIHKAYVRASKGNYSIEGLKGFDLDGKTMGVVGAGKIGLHVIRIAKSFNMNVLAFDVKEDSFLSEVLGFKYSSFNNILRTSDIISLHAPHNEKTHHLINKESIKNIKKGALLINTARGELIETEALAEALDKKIISGAGLDVLEGEELIKEEELLHYRKKSKPVYELALGRENVVFTPHIGFYSKEALERIVETTANNIISFLDGKPINAV